MYLYASMLYIYIYIISADLLLGLLIGIPVLKNLKVKPWERIVWWVSLIIYLVAVMFAVCWNAFYPGFPPTDWKPCCD